MHVIPGTIDLEQPVIKQGPWYTVATFQLDDGGTRELAYNEVAIQMSVAGEAVHGVVTAWVVVKTQGYIPTSVLLCGHSISCARAAAEDLQGSMSMAAKRLAWHCQESQRLLLNEVKLYLAQE
jgi:hypothetical protein